VKLLFEGGAKSGQTELGQFFEQRLGQHRVIPPQR
jgi:hypothetical protein